VIKQALKQRPMTLGVIQGGKQDEPELKLAGSGPKGPDWLRELGHGARFVCHPKNTVGCWLDQFGIAFIMDECILLAKTEGLGMSMGWVDSRVFSMQYRLVAVLPEQPDVEAGKDNGHNPSRPTDSEDNDGHEGPA